MLRKKGIIFEIEICIEKDGDGFHAFCPALKGVHVPGDTREEAIENVKEAIVLYIKSLIKHKEAIPLRTMVVEIPETSCSKPSLVCPPEQTQNILVTV